MKVCIMRGIPGSGKSTWLKTNAAGALVCSADSFFTGTDGVYRFDPTKLGDAHGACLRAYVEAILNEAPLIAVDNTNLSVAELAPYAALAAAYGADYEIIHVRADPAVAAARNLHGVPAAAILKMAGRVEQLPPFWRPERLVD